MFRMKRVFAVVVASGALAAGVAAPASAQPQTGLVNVAVTNNTVQIPVAVAANVCGVDVNVLAQYVSSGPVSCTAGAGAGAISTGGGGGGSTPQNGLINVLVSNNTVQVPVTVAANVCGVGVNVLAQFVDTGQTACTARSRGSAQG
jgi:hypothetical protein